MVYQRLWTPRAIILTSLILLLVFAVACGAAATATPGAKPATIPAPAAGAKATPVATPVQAVVPAGPVVNPGKLTLMVADLGNERFDYAFATVTVPSNSFGRIMHGFLLSDNAKREIVPGIASQWGLSADGLTWTFTIRKGVKFQNGSEVTPEDVVWSFQHLIGPQAVEYNFNSSTPRLMDRMELSGPDKVSLITKAPFPDFAYLVSEAGAEWNHVMPKRAKLRDTAEELAYDQNPIGAGSMRLEKHIRASVMKFVRFDDFYYQPKNGFSEDKRVNFKSLDLFLVPEEATRVAALRAGEADIVPASLATKQQVEAGGGRLVFGKEGVVLLAKLFGCWEPKYPCHDKRVRHALGYAINKELIRDKLFGGPEVFQVKGWTNVSPSTVGYTPALDPWPFDPNKARQLLADAGFPGGKGFGKLIINAHPSSSMPFSVEAAQLAAEFWRRELGLDVEVTVSDRTTVDKKFKARELDGQIEWRDNNARVSASSTMVSSYGDLKSPSRMTEDPEVIRLVQETVQMLDADKREEALKKLSLRLRDEGNDLAIGYVNVPWGVGPRVLTWQPKPLALFPSALHTITLK